MKCSKCGAECSGNFCSNCGAKLEIKPIKKTKPEIKPDTENKAFTNNYSPKKSNNGKKYTKTIIVCYIIAAISIVVIITLISIISSNLLQTQLQSATTSYNQGDDDIYGIDKNNDNDYDYSDLDDDEDIEDETEEETKPEKKINDYKKVSAKKLCYKPNKYQYDYIRTTFKINKISGYNYKYVTYGIGKYDKVEISCPLEDEDMELSEGVNLTVGGRCSLKKSTYEGEYGETRQKLTIKLTDGVWKIPKKSNFKPFGKSKSEAYLSSFSKLYSDYNVDIYYIDAEDDYGDVEARFLVNNKTNKQLTFQADTITLDGRSYSEIIMSDDVAAHSKGIISPTIYECKNNNPHSVGFKFNYFDEIGNATIQKDIVAYSQKVK